jgi:2-polyprenyl-6-methoxyphenol hydroxylase-like FAD-dependent oxidoreductase
LIAGDGKAAFALAMAIQTSGGEAVVAFDGRSGYAGREAVPAYAESIFDALSLGAVLQEASAQLMSGFGHGEYFVVDRLQLGAAMRSACASSGVALRPRIELEAIAFDAQTVKAKFCCDVQTFDFFVDATGRAATWSRPLLRERLSVADLYEGPTLGPLLRFARHRGAWTYVIGDARGSTIGCVTTARGKPPATLPAEVCAALRLGGVNAVFSSRQATWIQSADRPIVGRRISIGDAALVHDPISGQGVRFALTSALHAAAVIQTAVKEPERLTDCAAFYESAVRRERVAHVSAVADDGDASGADTSGSFRASGRYRFTAPVIRTKVLRGFEITSDDAVEIHGGRHVRWIGDFDILKLRHAGPDASGTRLVQHMRQFGFTPERAERILNWALDQGVLTECGQESHTQGV